MSVIGLIGGITPESTILYYKILNALHAKKLGAPHSAKVIISSFDFGEISKLQKENNWDALHLKMANAAKTLENAGVSCILICANTMHLSVNVVKQAVNTPVIHIAEATAEAIVLKKIRKVALLGTKYTMENPFFKDILKTFGIETILPNEVQRNSIHNVIYNELSIGLLKENSKQTYLKIIDTLIEQGAEGVILGCTEIPLLIHHKDVSVPVFDTTTLHASAGFNFINSL